VISETLPEPISWLGIEKHNLTPQKHAFINQNKCTTTNLSLTYLLRHLPTYLQPWTHTRHPKCKNGWFEVTEGHSRSLAMLSFSRVHCSAYNFLFTFHGNYSSLFSRYSKLFVESCKFCHMSRIFTIPHAFVAPRTPSQLHENVWHQKTTVPVHCLHDVTFSRFDRIPTCDSQMDRWKDRLTQDHSIYCSSSMPHATQ